MEFFKSLARKKDGAGPLTGRTVKVQSYLVKVEGVLGEGGFATIYRCSDNTTRAAFALKHFRLRCGDGRGWRVPARHNLWCASTVRQLSAVPLRPPWVRSLTACHRPAAATPRLRQTCTRRWR